jgi:hypothetical protein
MSADVDLSSCPTPIFIYLNGTLNFNTNGVRLRLPPGSGVIVGPTGSVIKTFPGGGSSTLIQSGGTNIWTAGTGDVAGPTVLGNSPLPIELVNFDGNICGYKICLNWSTSSETNNDFFSIERSADGYNFDKVADINGAGTSTITNTYVFSDEKPDLAIVYYRLVQNDFDGSQTFSSVIAVRLDEVMSFNCEVYPNPSNEEGINLEFNIKDPVYIEIRNAGSELLISKLVQPDVMGNVSLPETGKLHSGVYLITAFSGERRLSRRFVVVK